MQRARSVILRHTSLAMTNPFTPWLESGGSIVLDGGLGTELEARGHTQLGRIWSAALVRTNPAAIREVHRDYLEAGAMVVSTATYQAAMPTILQTGLHRAEAEDLLIEAVRLAVLERDAFADKHAVKKECQPLVAASIGPYGAALCNGAEYSGDYSLSEKQLVSFHVERWRVLTESDADIIACETIPSLNEARALLALMRATPERPAWLSLMCRDAKHLADGTPLEHVIDATRDVPNLCALGVNCLPPARARATVETIAKLFASPIIVYPNASDSWHSGSRVPGHELTPATYAIHAQQWQAAGARIIGGCCRTRPEHIRGLTSVLQCLSVKV